MVAVRVKGKDTKVTWENTGIYRAPKDSMQVTETLATRKEYLG